MDKHSGIEAGMQHTIIQISILHCSKTGRMYPYKMLKTMKQRKPMSMDVSKNDVYNAITSLEKSGLIKIYTEKAGRKKYCRITRKGSEVLESTKRIMARNLKEISKIIKEN